MSKDRVEIFSDAVIAIAMTILVLELHPPAVAEHASLGQYLTAMAPLGPKFLSFVLSFAMISIHWVSHHYFFRHLASVPVGLVWLNNLFLLGICFLPFPTAMLGDHPIDQFPVLLFAATSLFVALTFFAMRNFAVRWGLLKDDKPTSDAMGPRHSIPAIALYIAAIVFVFINTYVSLVCMLLVPVFYFVPGTMRALSKHVRR